METIKQTHVLLAALEFAYAYQPNAPIVVFEFKSKAKCHAFVRALTELGLSKAIVSNWRDSVSVSVSIDAIEAEGYGGNHFIEEFRSALDTMKSAVDDSETKWKLRTVMHDVYKANLNHALDEFMGK